MDVENCNINLLDKYIGKEVTYKQICKILDINYTSSNAKTRQLKYIKCYYNIEKHGTKFKIINKYDTPQDYEDKRKDKTIISKDLYDKHGVYYIVDNNKNIYIGSTLKRFGERYIGHASKYNLTTSKDIVNTDHVFNCLYDMTDIEDNTLIKMIENEYIEYFKTLSDYNVVNMQKALNTNKSESKIIKVNKYEYNKAIRILEENNIKVQ